MRTQFYSKSRSFELHEGLMAGELSSTHLAEAGSSIAFDREAPLDARPLIEDDHRTDSSSSTSEE